MKEMVFRNRGKETGGRNCRIPSIPKKEMILLLTNFNLHTFPFSPFNFSGSVHAHQQVTHVIQKMVCHYGLRPYKYQGKFLSAKGAYPLSEL